MEDVLRILAAGVNVVGSALVVLQFPWRLMPEKYIARMEEAARQGNSSLFITGVDPGFANDLIPFALAGTCQSIEQVRCMEIADYATYDGAVVMFDVMGFGQPLDEVPILFQPGVLSIASSGSRDAGHSPSRRSRAGPTNVYPRGSTRSALGCITFGISTMHRGGLPLNSSGVMSMPSVASQAANRCW